jgi:predicted lactoylglutathione lyase
MLAMARYGAKDIARAKQFYDAICETIGAQRIIDTDTLAVYKGPNGNPFIIGKPFEGDPTPGNGTQVVFDAPTRASVDAAHAKALELGCKSEGAPGPRGPAEMNMYACYVRDFDGNKIMVCRTGD